MFILPSRGRPNNVRRLIEAYWKTQATSYVYLILDEDDAHLSGYKAIEYPAAWVTHVASAGTLGGKVEAARQRFPNEPFYGFLADDIVPTTEEWDRELIREAGRWNIAYGDDKIQSEKLCTHPVIGGDLVRSVGWVILPGLAFLFADAAWMHIGQAIGALRYRRDVVLAHHHWSNGLASYDTTYATHSAYGTDQYVYERWRSQASTSLRLQALKELRSRHDRD